MKQTSILNEEEKTHLVQLFSPDNRRSLRDRYLSILPSEILDPAGESMVPPRSKKKKTYPSLSEFREIKKALEYVFQIVDNNHITSVSPVEITLNKGSQALSKYIKCLSYNIWNDANYFFNPYKQSLATASEYEASIHDNNLARFEQMMKVLFDQDNTKISRTAYDVIYQILGDELDRIPNVPHFSEVREQFVAFNDAALDAIETRFHSNRFPLEGFFSEVIAELNTLNSDVSNDICSRIRPILKKRITEEDMASMKRNTQKFKMTDMQNNVDTLTTCVDSMHVLNYVINKLRDKGLENNLGR